MKQIGIKLADGTFYPIMEDGKPVKKTLGLTTVNDNQTRVIVDVYRSQTGTMEDAEYIDSLQIDNLVAHPNGTADINLNIGLDENNKLHAEMIDPETGATSNANVTLVSRTLEERLEPTNYDVKLDDQQNDSFEELPEFDESLEDFELPDFENNDETIVENPISEETFSEDKNGNVIEDSEQTAQEKTEEPEISETEEIPAEPETSAEEETETEEKAGNGAAAAGIAGGAALGLLGAASLLKKKEEEKAKAEAEAEPTEPAEEQAADPTEETIPEENFAEPKETATEETPAETEIPDFPAEEEIPAAEKTDDSTISADDDFDLPDFNVDDGADETVAAEEPAGSADETPAANEANSSDATISSENADSSENSPFEDFDLPDFNEDDGADETVAAEEPENDEKSVLDDDAFFDSITSDDEDSKHEDENSTLVNDNTPSHGINFDGLYDKETAAGNSSDSVYKDDSEEIKKKTKAPVIICIICAIICILATLLILFVVPSKYNLLNKSEKHETTAAEEIQDTEPEQEEISELPAEEPEQKPVVIEPKEEEIVVAPEPEQVVPETPKEPETKPADITYKIKWGDTLWDIADSYYKNPWNYKKIARYNNIKNPDYIISGTTITIPAK